MKFKIIALIACLIGSNSYAATGHVVDVAVYNGADPGVPNRVLVTVDVSTICPTSKSFVVLDSDPYYKDIYAMALSALATGNKITFNEVYCNTDLNSVRANEYHLTITK
ncbi:MAG: hypothetical protein AABY83_00325 [Pseudomonadota bacterium]